jgi:uncharacterized MnhB-related membrane protein
MLLMQVTILIFVAIAGTGVVLTRDPASQAVVVSFYGLLLAVMFFLYQAPDVSLSQIVVGAVALPLMILLALAKIRSAEEHTRKEEEAGTKGKKRGAE